MPESYKELVRNFEQSDLNQILFHYAIQGTFDIYTHVIENDDWQDEWDHNGFAECVIDTFQEFDFEEEHDNIAAVISLYYLQELNAINNLAKSKQKPKSWAYLVRFE